MVVGSLASTTLLGLSHDASLSPAVSGSRGPLFASKQAHEWLEQSITRAHWVSPDAQVERVDYVSLPAERSDAMQRGVAMADTGKRTAQNSRAQF